MEPQRTYPLSRRGNEFIKKCIQLLEDGGLTELGIYRVSGFVTSIENLLALGLSEDQQVDVFNDPKYAELMSTKTLSGAVKSYIRNLQEPLVTYKLFPYFINAGSKLENTRHSDIQS